MSWRGCWTGATEAPARRAVRPGLELAIRLGRIGAACLIIGNLLYLFAPLFYLANLEQFVDTRQASGEFVSQVSDPGMLASIADLVIAIGLALLALALAFLLAGLWRARRRPAKDAFPFGVAAVACLAAAPAVTAWTEARGGVGSIDAVIATGGWSVGSALLLAASLLYLAFCLRAERALKPTKLACVFWPAYAAVNVLGAATFAGLIEETGAGGANLYPFLAGLALKIVLIPILAVVAYRELLIRLPDWEKADVAPRPRKHAAAPAPKGFPAEPPPPPPEDEVPAEPPPLGD